MSIANVDGLYAELLNDTARRSFVHCASTSLAFRQIPGGFVRLWLPIQKTFDVVSSQPSSAFEAGSSRLLLFLANRIKAGRDIVFIELNEFVVLCCPCTGPLVPCQEQLDYQTSLVGLYHGQRHRWGGSGMQCAVIRAESCLNLRRWFLELIAEHPRTQHSCLAKMIRRIFVHGTGSSDRTLAGQCSSMWHMQTRRCRNHTTFVDESSLAGACTSSENPRRPGDEVTARPLRQLRQWNGLVLDRSEHALTGETVDGQDEDEQQRAAVHTICGCGQGDGWSPGSTSEPREGDTWDEVSIWARCSAQCAKLLKRSMKTSAADRAGLSSRGHTSVRADDLCTVAGKRNPFAVIAHKKVVTMDLFGSV